MWKTIIEYIKSKSYRCEHSWENIAITEFMATEKSTMPHARKYVYRCTKCCEFKSFKS